MSNLTISKVTSNTVQRVVPLFEAYRQFYSQPSDLEGARAFLSERLARSESVIFLACLADQPVGFAQLYPSFSSLAMKRIWILNDLYVSPSGRGQGVGPVLLEQCRQYAIETGAKKLTLETMKTNQNAQRLYEKHGWKHDEDYYHYSLRV